MSLTQVFSWNDLTWWAAGNPLAAPAHSLILLTGLKDQSNGAAVAHALWRFYAWNFHKHVSVLQSDVTALVISLSRYHLWREEGRVTPVVLHPSFLSLCVLLFWKETWAHGFTRTPEVHQTRSHRVGTAPPCGALTLLHVTERNAVRLRRKSRFFLNAPLFIFHCGLYCGSLFYSFHVLVLFHLPFFILTGFFYCSNFMFSIFLIQLIYFCIFLT